jgi:hypothetical protein
MDNGKNKYIKTLQNLDFQVENRNDSSVYLVNKQESYIEQGATLPYVIIALDKAKAFEADAVYFRFFDDNRPPLPQIYIYDNTSESRPPEYYAEKHREIWSSCDVAIFFVIGKTTIKIFDSRKPVKIDNNGNLSSEPIETIELLSQVNDAFTKYKAQHFDNGSFWESKTSKKHFLTSKIASERLVRGLKEIRNKLHNGNLLSSALIDRLLIMCMLIKYLEETGIDKTTGKNYAGAFFKEATGHEQLVEIIRNNKVNDLLSALTRHFNGGIFYLDDVSKQELCRSDISIMAQFFEAGYKTNLFGWKEYSFEHIPVELISNFYEELIPKTGSNNKKSTGAVYTPSFLVNLLVDECLPLDNRSLNENIKLIDPACGSGIFLVAAYKRLVQRWRIKNTANNKLADTKPVELKAILSNNIFGVDTNPISANLSIFSLQLALCSMLTPKQIWTELQFLDLQSNGNIVQRDFFDYLIDADTKQDFDLVIGNPPFKRKNLNGKNYNYYTQLLQDKFPLRFKNPQREFAILFLEKAMHLLKNKKGKLCLILPSGPLLYTEDSLSLRKQLFSIYNVSQIIDFTFLRRVLFQATVSSMALFAEYSNPSDVPVLHIVAKRTRQSKERFYFEFDHYDFYKVPKKFVVDKINLWKCNLLGGYMVCDIIDKLNKLNPDLKAFCQSNAIVSHGNSIGKNYATPAQRSEGLFSFEQLNSAHANDFWGIRKTIKKGAFPEELTDDDFIGKTKIDAIGFCGTSSNIMKLKNYINKYSDIISFYIAAVSGRQGVRSPYVFYLSDLEKFPVNENLNDHITRTDEIIIDDFVNYTLDELGNGEKSSISLIAKRDNLTGFAQIYCDALNLYYRSENKSYKLINLIEGDAYYICELQHTDRSISQVAITTEAKNLNVLLAEWNLSKSVKTNKIMRYYDSENQIIRIIKPKQLRFWLKSKALRDADETFSDILTC